MKIRQHKILTQTLLILFIINFALAAPAAVRERPGHDANGTRDVAAASQKRWDPPDEGELTNVPGAGDTQQPGAPPPSTPPPGARPPGAPQPILDSTGWVQRLPMVPYSPHARPLNELPLGVQPPSASESPLRVPVLRPRPLRFKPLLPRPPGAPLSSAPTPGVLQQRPSASEFPLVPALGPRPLRFKPILPRPPGVPLSSAPTPGLQQQRPSASESPLRVPALRPRPLRFRPILPRPPGAPLSSAPAPGLQRQRPSVLPSRLRPPNTGDLYQQMRTAMQVAREAYIIDLWRAQQSQALQHPGSSTENVLPSPRPPTTLQLGPGLSGMRVGSLPAGSSSKPPPPSTPASQPGPSEDRPPGFPVNPGASSSTGYQPSPGVMQETDYVPSMEDQPIPGAKQETHSAPSTEDLPPDFWDGLWKDLPSTFKEAFSISHIKPRIFHHQDDTC